MPDVVETLSVALGDILTVARCAGCDGRLRQRAVFCAVCAATVEPAPPFTFERTALALRVEAAAQYGGAVAVALNKLKHHDRPDLARPLGHMLRRLARRRAWAGPDCVVPVPLHRVRLAERRYNPAALLAAELAAELRAPLSHHCLERTAPTRPQQGLSGVARRRNVAGAFRVGADVRGAHVLLLDDVCTTGATLAACACALLAGGAARVEAGVVARRVADVVRG